MLRRRNRVMIIVGSVFLAVGLILAGVFVAIGSQDYSAYTARAQATVAEIEVHTSRSSSGGTSQTREYDVTFQVDGRTVRVDDIGGVHTGDFSEGDLVHVAFPPGQPERAVWATTVEGGLRVLLWVGVGVGAFFGLLGALLLVLGLHGRVVPADAATTGGGVTGPLLPDPGPAAEIGRAWSFDEVVSELARSTSGTPYTVDRGAGSVTVRIDLADTSWWHLLQRQGLTRSFATTLTPIGKNRLARTDIEQQLEWAAGPDGRLTPVLTGSASISAGRSWSLGSQQIWALTPSGYRKVVDYSFDSSELQSLIGMTLERAGWSVALDTQSRIGLWVAVIAGAGAVAAVVLVVLI